MVGHGILGTAELFLPRRNWLPAIGAGCTFIWDRDPARGAGIINDIAVSAAMRADDEWRPRQPSTMGTSVSFRWRCERDRQPADGAEQQSQPATGELVPARLTDMRANGGAQD